MAKLVLPTLESGFLSVEELNSAFREIEAFAETLVSRDGALPNQMAADLDLNGYRVLNIEPAVLPGQAATLGQVQAQIDAASSGIVVQRQQSFTATAGQTIFNLTTTSYTPGANNVAVYVNGARKFSGVDFTETNATRVTMAVPLALNDKVTVATNEYLGTVTPPTVNITWSSINSGTIPDFASRWPTYAEVTGKPTEFTPAAHTQGFNTLTGFATDAQREVYVQATQPVAQRVGALWFW